MSVALKKAGSDFRVHVEHSIRNRYRQKDIFSKARMVAPVLTIGKNRLTRCESQKDCKRFR